MWFLHRLLQLNAYRDLFINWFAISVVFFRIFQWKTSYKLCSQWEQARRLNGPIESVDPITGRPGAEGSLGDWCDLHILVIVQ
jgi:hypothetical protein